MIMEDDNLTNFFSSVNEEFVTEIVQKFDNNIVFRSNVKNDNEVQRWLKIFSQETNTQWIVHSTYPNPIRFIYRKIWICHRSKRHKTIKKSQRCTDCKAVIDVKIRKNNKNTRKNDAFQTLETPLSAIIKVIGPHNHNVGTADSMKFLRVSDQVQQQYFDYFESGMGPSAAIRLHESKILANKDDASKDMANPSINPTHRMVYCLYDKWRETNCRNEINPLLKLKEKLSLGVYECEDMTVKVREESPWAVIVVTPIMKRAQSLRTSRELIFCDSTESFDGRELSVTAMLVATKAGAIPIAVIIHENQTTEGYMAAFTLLKECFPECFGCASYPEVFMTDDSNTMKAALKVLWPESKQLLSHFHVAQAEWRWLFAYKNCIPSGERVTLIRLFQQVMCANSEEELKTTGQAIIKKAEHVQNFVSRFMKFLERGDEWLYLHRKDLLTLDNDTNKYVEASIRTLKDILLSHTRAFNVVALVEFCTHAWENYLVRHVLSFSHDRISKSSLMYENLVGKLMHSELRSAFDAEKIRHLGDNVFSIPSGKLDGIVYTVDTSVGLCTCYSGNRGGFCKHQAAIDKLFGSNMPNAPSVTAVERHSLAYLALGDKCPKLSFFLDLQGGVQCSPHEGMSSSETENLQGTSEIQPSMSGTTVTASPGVIMDQQSEDYFGSNLPNVPPVTANGRHSLAYFGAQCPKLNFFLGLQGGVQCSPLEEMSSSEMYPHTSCTTGTSHHGSTG